MKSILLILFMSLSLSFSGYSQTNSPTFKSVSAKEFKNKIDSNLVTLIDVRTAQEFSESHISGALNVDVNSADFVAQVSKLIKNKPLALYCRSGRRSKLAASKLNRLGVKIYELNNGFNDWVLAGFATIK